MYIPQVNLDQTFHNRKADSFSGLIPARQRSCGKIMFFNDICAFRGGVPSLYKAMAHPPDTSLYRDPSPKIKKTCSNLFTMKHVRSAIGQLASYWNAFLYNFITTTLQCLGVYQPFQRGSSEIAKWDF